MIAIVRNLCFIVLKTCFFFSFQYILHHRRENDEVEVSNNGPSSPTNNVTQSAVTVQTVSYKKLEESITKDVFISEAPPHYDEITRNHDELETILLTGESGTQANDSTPANVEPAYPGSAQADELVKVDLGSIS